MVSNQKEGRREEGKERDKRGEREKEGGGEAERTRRNKDTCTLVPLQVVIGRAVTHLPGQPWLLLC